jgi:hypothetical protein
MSLSNIKFKTMLCRHDKESRRQILDALLQWLSQQFAHDAGAMACYNSLQEAYAVNGWAENKAFKEHYLWFPMQNHNTCRSFQEIVKAKLEVPKINIALAVSSPKTTPRKAIPKKIRGEVWLNQFGNAMTGACYCCKTPFGIFDTWHAGHIVPHASGGTDTAENLRPVCGSCNLSMGTENMDAFKARCYPHET